MNRKNFIFTQHSLWLRRRSVGLIRCDPAAGDRRRQESAAGRFRSTILIVCMTAMLAGCATWPDRPAISPETAAAASINGFAEIRIYADADVDQWLRWRKKWEHDRKSADAVDPIRMLAISSGSDKGAFAAGLLNGWSEGGNRPDFSLVTGTSTGALIAPFAFLGRKHDVTLRTLYTTISAKDIFRKHPIEGVLGGVSLADSAPLYSLIDQYLTTQIVEEIGIEHRKGRRLLVATTNLDAQRGVVWDIGAIAISSDPRKATLIRQILLASASIPGLFPPVLMNVQNNGQRLTEMHVDGGTTASMFVVPTALLRSNSGGTDVEAPRSIDLIYNGTLQSRYEVIEPRTFTIMERALSTAILAADKHSIAAYDEFAKRHDTRFSVWTIDLDFADDEHALFDQKFMTMLFDYGHQKGLGIRPIAKSSDPGFSLRERLNPMQQ
ncbi:patatin-like phospholipase family protein [Parasphingorhabdus sp.]|uniref:patatin-like phospholipase family protein n=1 Tax=Parasphingorhabdus sp. TaxID=2709688 RepID=UPI002F94285E